jgi:hypothetical protein
MKRHIKLVWILSVSIFACKSGPVEFQKLGQFSKTDSIIDNGKPIYFKTDVYIVKNYYDDKKNESTVDSFAYRNKPADLGNISDYNIVIYKHSKRTDIENLARNPKDFETHSFENDMIYLYRWGGGKWSSKTKFKGRKIVEGQEMIRED